MGISVIIHPSCHPRVCGDPISKSGVVEGFTKKYSIHLLVYYEQFESIEQAITREKQLKKWERYWKIKLINTKNPTWRDLYKEVC